MLELLVACPSYVLGGSSIQPGVAQAVEDIREQSYEAIYQQDRQRNRIVVECALYHWHEIENGQKQASDDSEYRRPDAAHTSKGHRIGRRHPPQPQRAITDNRERERCSQ